MLSSENGRTEIVSLLLENLNYEEINDTENITGDYAQQLAEKNGHSYIAKLINNRVKTLEDEEEKEKEKQKEKQKKKI